MKVMVCVIYETSFYKNVYLKMKRNLKVQPYYW